MLGLIVEFGHFIWPIAVFIFVAIGFLVLVRRRAYKARHVLQVLFIVFGGCAAVAVAIKMLHAPNMPQSEMNLLTLILTALSIMASWAASGYYYEVDREEKAARSNDPIGERASEKIMKQSKLLFDLEAYIDSWLEDSDDGSRLGMVLDFVQFQLQTIRTNNDLYVNDWLPIVSASVADQIKGEVGKQKERFLNGEIRSGKTTHSIDLAGPLSPATFRSRAKAVVLIRDEKKISSASEVKGVIEIEIMRPVKFATATVVLATPFASNVSRPIVKFISGPALDEHVWANAGIDPDLNRLPIHLYPKAPAEMLPPGRYLLEYMWKQ